MCRNFIPIYIELYSIYSSSNFIFCCSICPCVKPCYSCLFNDAIFIISSNIKISSRHEEISSVLVTIRSRIKTNISIISSSWSSRNINSPSSFATKNHCVSANTATEYSNLSIVYLIYCSSTKNMKKISIKSV